MYIEVSKKGNKLSDIMKSSFDITASDKQKMIVNLINKTGKSYEQLKAEGYIPENDIKGSR